MGIAQLASPRWAQSVAARLDFPLPGGPAIAIAIRLRPDASAVILSAISPVSVACVMVFGRCVDEGKTDSSNVTSSPKM